MGNVVWDLLLAVVSVLYLPKLADWYKQQPALVSAVTLGFLLLTSVLAIRRRSRDSAAHFLATVTAALSAFFLVALGAAKALELATEHNYVSYGNGIVLSSAVLVVAWPIGWRTEIKLPPTEGRAAATKMERTRSAKWALGVRGGVLLTLAALVAGWLLTGEAQAWAELLTWSLITGHPWLTASATALLIAAIVGVAATRGDDRGLRVLVIGLFLTAAAILLAVVYGLITAALAMRDAAPGLRTSVMLAALAVMVVAWPVAWRVKPPEVPAATTAPSPASQQASATPPPVPPPPKPVRTKAGQVALGLRLLSLTAAAVAVAGGWLSGDARAWWPAGLAHPWLASLTVVVAVATIIGWSLDRRDPRDQRVVGLVICLILGLLLWGAGALIALLVRWIF